ncbi:VOC family protein, partial [Streptomyces albidoflavus]
LPANSIFSADAPLDKAIASGGAPAGETQEQGDFMYGRAFFDPDGHHFEVVWMDPSVIEG